MTNQRKKASDQGKPAQTRKSSRKPAVSLEFSPRSNRAAVELVIDELVKQRRLGTLHQGLINACRSAATLVDDQPTPAALKEYANLLVRLTALGEEDANGFDALVAELRTTMGNPS